MSGVKDIFLHLDESVKLQVQLGHDKQVQVDGRDTIVARTKSGKEKHLDNVLYIPGLAHNLLHIGQLIQRGYSVLFHDNVCEIHDLSRTTVMKVKMTKNKMFPLQFSCHEDHALVVNVENESYLWHLQYGHLHFNGLKLPSQKKMVVTLPLINHIGGVCEGCVCGKQQRSTLF